MKKLFLPILCLLFLISCDKESANDLLYEQETSLTIRSSNKIDICQNGNIINVNVNAIPAHQAQGNGVDMDGDSYFDIDNPCSETDCDDNNYDIDNFCGCVEGELEVTLPDGTILYVHPIDNDAGIKWGDKLNDIDGLDNIFTLVDANADFNGAANTAAIVADLGNWNGGDYAANLCATLSTETGCEWYLPAAGELNAMYQQLDLINNGFNVTGAFYWTSTERISYTAYGQSFYNGFVGVMVKSSTNACRCVRK